MEKNNHKHIYKVMPLGISTRVALFMLLFTFLPMLGTGIMIEKHMLLPGKNLYLAIPIFFLPLIFPLSKFISYYLIDKDLQVIERFCEQIKLGHYDRHFDLPNQKEEEDTLLSLLRNLTWMAHSLSNNESDTQNRFGRLQNNLTKIQQQAVTDPLTKLYNRRYLATIIENNRKTDPYLSLSMLYIDCDKFKQVNDRLGHAIGDEVLIWLAKCLQQTGREEKDIPLRFGGDEFAMLVKDVTSSEAIQIAERIQELYHKRDVFQTSLSIGIAHAHNPHIHSMKDMEELIKNADKQVYHAKKSGGNCISINSSLVPKDHEKDGLKHQECPHELAYVDPLTGTPNRYLAKEHFAEALIRSQRNAKKLCLLFLDLDDFKEINDGMGYAIGDKYLQHVVRCIKQVLRTEDSLCRFGGDEFLILFENITSKNDIPTIVSKIFEAVATPLHIEGHTVVTTASLGITLIPDDGIDFEDLCKRADIALNTAKSNGKNTFYFFDPKMADSLQNSISLLTDLRGALAKRQLELYLQPQMNLASGTLVSAEALIRWNHPEKGLIFPNDFIELAEKSNLIIEIGYWIIDEACRICAELIAHGLKDMIIAINVSAVQLNHPSFAHSVLNSIEKHEICGNNIELEFTESLLVKDNNALSQDLTLLREKGIKLAIDDFGTGYSNLGYIKTFDITKIKIDRSFVGGITKDKNNKAIVDAIIRMSRSLSIETVAEGIEDQHTLKLLRQLGGQTGQGFYWHKPMQLTDFIKEYCTPTTS